MTDYVHRRFPEYIRDIQAVKAKDAAFREACDNYEEICAWAAEQCSPEQPGSDACDQARELVRDLEVEILSLLRDARKGYPET